MSRRDSEHHRGKCRSGNECKKRGEREEKERRCLIQRKTKKKRWSYESGRSNWDFLFYIYIYIDLSFQFSPEEQLKKDE